MAGVNENSDIQGMMLKGENIIARTRPNRKALSTVDNNVIGVQKRGVLTEKNAVSHKNSALPLHRPITRNFAAQLAVKEKQLQHKEVKPSLHQTIGHQSSECTIINAEDFKASSYDHDVPMYVQYTEAMLEEIDQMDAEVEMEELDSDEEVMDIDARDKANPLAVTEYIDDIHAHYKKTESSSCVPPNYMSQQFDINDRMRGILIDWLIEVHYKFELMDETLYLTVNLIDRFLSLQSVGRKKLQLVGVTALLLACKYEEVSVPVVEDLVLISDRAYSRKEVLEMERLILNTLQFNMSFPTPYVFLRRFLKSAQSDKKLENVSFFVLELSLVEYEMLRFPPSLLASAAIFTAQCTLGEGRKWSKKCEIQSGYSKGQLMECTRMMMTLHRNAGTGKLIGVYKKYSTSKYGCAAKLEPAAVLEGAGL